MSAQKGTPEKKGPGILGGLLDLFISVLLLVAAGFGGYYWGLHQRLAPVKEVAAGTPGAVAPGSVEITPSKDAEPKVSGSAAAPPAGNTKKTEESSPAAVKQSAKIKYWLTSSGADRIGFYIVASVNGTQVDNFFGPGKTLDVTRYVKSGENEVLFDAKFQGDDYNKHKGDAKSVLTVKLVKGPQVQEDYKKSDVVLTYRINAADEGDKQESMHFVKE